MQQKLWKKIGAEASCIAARISRMNARVVSDKWIRESTKPDAAFLEPSAANGSLRVWALMDAVARRVW